MPVAPRDSRMLRLFVAGAVGAIGFALALPAARGQTSHAGPVTGVIDGVAFEGDQYYVHGWACQEIGRAHV